MTYRLSQNSIIFSFIIGLLLSINTATAQIVEPPVIIDPPNPITDELIRIGIAKTNCFDLPAENIDGISQLIINQENEIEFFAVNIPYPVIGGQICIPITRIWYDLGVFDTGSYTLDTFLVSNYTPLPLPENLPPIAPYGSEITFTVLEPKNIDSTSNSGLILLFTSILVLTLFLLNGNKNFTFRR